TEHAETADNQAAVSERAHPSRDPASLRRDSQLLHAALPRAAFCAVVLRPAVAGRRISALIRLLVSAGGDAVTERARNPLRKFRQRLRARRASDGGVPAAAVARRHAGAGRTCACEGIYQHTEL